MIRWIFRLSAAGIIAAASPSLADNQDADFMKFPMAVTVSSAKGPAFAWIVRQGDDSIIMFARGPVFKSTRLFTRADTDGQPVSSVKLSPDGRFVVFQTGESWGHIVYNPANLVEPPKTTWWIMESRAGAKPVEIEGGAEPFFSPDGRRMVYGRQGDLWAIELGATSGTPTLLAKGAGVFGSPIWAPDGSRFYFIQYRGSFAYLGAYWIGAPQVEWLVTGPNRLDTPVLSPDGKTIAYRRFPALENSVVYDSLASEPFAIDTVDVATRSVRTIWEAREPAAAMAGQLYDVDHALRWVGNERIAFFSEHDGWGRLYAVPRAGGQISALSPANCETAESELGSDDTLLVAHNCRDLDGRQLSLIDVRTGRERELASKDIVVAYAKTAKDSPYIAFTGGNAEEAPLLRIVDSRTGQIVMAEKASDYGFRYRYAAPAPKTVRFKAPDGLTIPGHVFLPSTPGPHPAIVYVHGGPARQMFPSFFYNAYFANHFAMNRRFAELGYVVLSVNYRSGNGYGRAYREPANRAWRGASEYQDVVASAQWLRSRKDIDPARIGIWGSSYGGLLTGQALARNSDLFAAGIAIHGVYDWSWPSPTPGHLNPSIFFGVNEKDRPLARKSSPVGSVDGWRSPVLLVSGDQDMNVDVLETIDLAAKLKARNVDVRTMLIPGEGHDFTRHENYRRLWQEAERFFGEKLKTK